LYGQSDALPLLLAALSLESFPAAALAQFMLVHALAALLDYGTHSLRLSNDLSGRHSGSSQAQKGPLI